MSNKNWTGFNIVVLIGLCCVVSRIGLEMNSRPSKYNSKYKNCPITTDSTSGKSCVNWDGYSCYEGTMDSDKGCLQKYDKWIRFLDSVWSWCIILVIIDLMYSPEWYVMTCILIAMTILFFLLNVVF